MATKVIFRKFKDGDIVALFPQEPGTNESWTCESYMHIGQHSAAHFESVVSITRPAKPEEYADLLKELESIGYNDLTIAKMSGQKDYEIRSKKVRRKESAF